ncbi:uncharacterized protein LOC123547076 [Mercenaria mercenaria]|uniref:uncharacterized protein LOC123547076 n=1 Tax=Mercenaria mercenaria TaxID=6596 RepID=UPI00234E433B|nr:uncharacterized protein LOC123547076 [Mercenaria mercenaria]
MSILRKTKMSSNTAIYLIVCLVVSLLISADGKNIWARPSYAQRDGTLNKPTDSSASIFNLQPDTKRMEKLRTSKYQPNTSIGRQALRKNDHVDFKNMHRLPNILQLDTRIRPVERDTSMTKKRFSWFNQDAGARLILLPKYNNRTTGGTVLYL